MPLPVKADQDLQRLCKKHIEELIKFNHAVTTAIVSTVDGFEVAFSGSDKLNAATLSAMSSSQLAISDAICSGSSVGTCQNIVIEADQGRILLMNIPCTHFQLLLTVFCHSNELLGRLLWAVHGCVRQITLQLEEMYTL